MSRTRTRRLVVAGLLAVIAAALAGWWAYDHFTLNAAERNLVGTWAQTRDGTPDGILVEFVLREDRTVRLINRDAKTGAVLLALEEYDQWRASDSVVTLRRRPEASRARPWYTWWGRPRRANSYDELHITPEGPDRVRYTLTRTDQPNIRLTDPLPTGTWTRISNVK